MLMFRTLLVVVAALSVSASACAASGKMEVSTGGGAHAEANASSDNNTPAPVTATSSAPVADTAPATATCPFVCFNANTGRGQRIAPEDETRLASGVSGEMQTLRSCTRAGSVPSLTLRFDGTGALSEFGVDDEHASSDSGCVDGVRSHKPAITYPGPATIRCSERCAGEARTSSSGRRRR